MRWRRNESRHDRLQRQAELCGVAVGEGVLLREAQGTGFGVLTVCGNDGISGLSLRDVTMRHKHVHFAARKR